MKIIQEAKRINMNAEGQIVSQIVRVVKTAEENRSRLGAMTQGDLHKMIGETIGAAVVKGVVDAVSGGVWGSEGRPDVSLDMASASAILTAVSRSLRG